MSTPAFDSPDGWERTKSSLHFSSDDPLPRPIVSALVALRMAEIDNLHVGRR